MKKLALCLAVVGACLYFTGSPNQAAAVQHPCLDCGGCCACVRPYPGGPCRWLCC